MTHQPHTTPMRLSVPPVRLSSFGNIPTYAYAKQLTGRLAHALAQNQNPKRTKSFNTYPDPSRLRAVCDELTNHSVALLCLLHHEASTNHRYPPRDAVAVATTTLTVHVQLHKSTPCHPSSHRHSTRRSVKHTHSSTKVNK